jgi:DNA-3-methyladenine glycosylase I
LADLARGADGKPRCGWGDSSDQYRDYHDTEWGRPVVDEQGLFERLCLELMQSGLSFALILRKREGMREAFARFDPEAVAGLKIAPLLRDERVIRNRAKLEAIVQNAKATIAMRDEVPLPDLIWSFRRRNKRAPRNYFEMVSFSPESKELAKELKRRGFAFVGPTTVYSTLQAVGVVNDHLSGCFVRAEVEAERQTAALP